MHVICTTYLTNPKYAETHVNLRVLQSHEALLNSQDCSTNKMFVHLRERSLLHDNEEDDGRESL